MSDHTKCQSSSKPDPLQSPRGTDFYIDVDPNDPKRLLSRPPRHHSQLRNPIVSSEPSELDLAHDTTPPDPRRAAVPLAHSHPYLTYYTNTSYGLTPREPMGAEEKERVKRELIHNHRMGEPTTFHREGPAPDPSTAYGRELLELQQRFPPDSGKWSDRPAGIWCPLNSRLYSGLAGEYPYSELNELRLELGLNEWGYDSYGDGDGDGAVGGIPGPPSRFASGANAFGDGAAVDPWSLAASRRSSRAASVADTSGDWAAVDTPGTPSPVVSRKPSRPASGTDTFSDWAAVDTPGTSSPVVVSSSSSSAAAKHRQEQQRIIRQTFPAMPSWAPYHNLSDPHPDGWGCASPTPWSSAEQRLSQADVRRRTEREEMRRDMEPTADPMEGYRDCTRAYLSLVPEADVAEYVLTLQKEVRLRDAFGERLRADVERRVGVEADLRKEIADRAEVEDELREEVEDELREEVEEWAEAEAELRREGERRAGVEAELRRKAKASAEFEAELCRMVKAQAEAQAGLRQELQDMAEVEAELRKKVKEGSKFETELGRIVEAQAQMVADLRKEIENMVKVEAELRKERAADAEKVELWDRFAAGDEVRAREELEAMEELDYDLVKFQLEAENKWRRSQGSNAWDV